MTDLMMAPRSEVMRDVPSGVHDLDELRDRHRAALADVAFVQAAVRMDAQGLPTPWEAEWQVAVAGNRHREAVAAMARRRAEAVAGRAQLRADAASVVRADQRAMDAGRFRRRSLERAAARLRADVAARSEFAFLPEPGSKPDEWTRWIETSTEMEWVTYSAAAENAEEDLAQATASLRQSESWWEGNVPAETSASPAVREELGNLSYPSTDAREVYQHQLERSVALEKSLAVEVGRTAARMAATSAVVSAGATALTGTAAVGATAMVVAAADVLELSDTIKIDRNESSLVPIVSASRAIFGADGDRTLEEVMGTPLEGLNARLDAIVATPGHASELRPIESASPLHSLGA